MKKLISCLLAVLLVCSLMSMSVFADRVVGNTGSDPAINNGVDSFDPSEGLGGSNTNINVNFGQGTTTNPGEDAEDPSDDIINGGGTTIVHKYAVDITYGEFILDLTKLELGKDDELPGDGNGNGTFEENETIAGPFYMVWDVNNYNYVLCGKVGDKYVPVVDDNSGATDPENPEEDETTEDITDILETPFELDSKVTVTNHSDLSVFTKLVLTNDRADINWEITAAAGEGEATATEGDNTATGKNDTATATEEITKATAATDTANGEATDGSTYSFTATPAATDGWLGVIGNLLNETNTVKIGSITVTIAKDAASLNA